MRSEEVMEQKTSYIVGFVSLVCSKCENCPINVLLQRKLTRNISFNYSLYIVLLSFLRWVDSFIRSDVKKLISN